MIYVLKKAGFKVCLESQEFAPGDESVSTEPTMPLDDKDEADRLNYVPDDLTEYTEEDDDRLKPVTGVPLALWSVLAVGALVGGGLVAMTGRTGATAGPIVATYHIPPQLLETNPNSGTVTDAFFPPSSMTVPCAGDPACQAVMEGLGPNMPPGTQAAMDIPGTCQFKARDWLRTGKDVLEFKAERIRQRYAFSVFFCETDGGNWLENDMWLSDLHECDWYNRIGLDPCNRIEQLEMLRIHDNGLQGTLPLELSIISTLYEFTVSDNLITGSFPPEYAALSELDTFVIAFNLFEGPLPGFFFRFPDMVYLDLAYNRFTGTLPQDIPEQMADLQILFAENNQIAGSIPANLSDLRIRKMHLDDNMFTGPIPTEFGQLNRLEQLYLHGNQLTGGIPAELSALTTLKEASFHFNDGLTGNVDSNICELMYQQKLSTISVDCANVVCDCCTCGTDL